MKLPESIEALLTRQKRRAWERYRVTPDVGAFDLATLAIFPTLSLSLTLFLSTLCYSTADTPLFSL